jgi:predicted RND superfamily exporter protein
MTVVTNVLPAFLACVGVADSIHIQSVYRDARARGVDNREAIIHAVATTGPPILFTTMTTAAGLLSFRFASLQAIVDVGTFGALGVCAALLYSLVFLPIVLDFNRKSLLGVRSGARRADRLDRFLDFCNGLSRDRVTAGGKRSSRRRRLNLLASALLAAGGLVGASMLSVRHDPLTWFPPQTEIRQTYAEMDAHVGGTANVVLLIEALPGKTIKDRELLLRLERFEKRIEPYRLPGMQEPMVDNTTSVLDVVRESWRALNGGGDAFYELPDSQRGVVDMFTLFESASPDELKRLVTIDTARALMNIRVKWMDAWSYRPLTEAIQSEVEKGVGDRAKAKLTGTVFAFFSVVAALIGDLLRSFSTAFVAITIMMILLLRELKLGLISMLPNLLPIVVVMGMMGFADIRIDVSNMLIASIAIGIAVDDTIHFLHQFRIHYRLTGDVDAAIDHAFSHTGRAIAMTSLILVSGFCVMLAASMSNIQRFGSLVSLTIVLALFIDLIFAPALLRTFYKSRAG